MRKTSLFTTLICFAIQVFPQEINSSLNGPAMRSITTSERLTFSFVNNNFLRNNEYFNPFTEGITYFGSLIQPEVAYTFSEKSSLSLGWYLRYYYGQKDIKTSLPVIRFEVEPYSGHRIIVGQLFGMLDHKLIEPIYSTDNYFSRNPEYGFQYKGKIGNSTIDAWISWEHFIFPGDNDKEEISGGVNTSFALLQTPAQTSLSLHLQGIVHHFGGQVDESGKPLETRMNLAPGIEFDTRIGDKTNLNLAGYLIQASDHSSITTIPYKKGYAAYLYGTGSYQWVRLTLAWFHGEYYFSPLGERMFQSISELNDWYVADQRNLITSKLLFDFKISEGVSAALRFESYYDPHLRNMDFSYGLNFRTCGKWKLW